MQRQKSTEGSLSQRQPFFVHEKPSKRMFDNVLHFKLVEENAVENNCLCQAHFEKVPSMQ